MQPPHLAQFAPLHKGRSFICYRDVNKAIEKHRELYGLRLVLKKAIKLENYCLTVDQMRDLNFRLKYGELDYQCSVDNGRPGRPGNDERCPRLVRLRLSPDARTLVVYDTHIHEPIFKSQSQVQGISPPCPLQGPLPDIPYKDGAAEAPACQPPACQPPACQPPACQPPACQTTPSTSTYQPTPSIEKSTPKSTHTTPVVTPSYEKITVKLKKSQFSPNEMVVVGSARDAQEQLELRNTPEKTVQPSMQSTPKLPDKPDPTALARQLVEKLQENKSTTVVFKPAVKAPAQVVPEARENTITTVAVVAKPFLKIAPKPPEISITQVSDKIEEVSTKQPDKDENYMKKPVLVKALPRILPKPVKPIEKEPVKAPQKILPKPIEKSTSKPTEKVVIKAPEKFPTKPSEKAIGKTLERNGTASKGPSAKAPVRLSQRCLDKNAQRNSSSNGSSSDFQPSPTNSASRNENVMAFATNGQRTTSGGNGKRMYRKKKTRQSDQAYDVSSLVPLDTELGFNEKQQLAHGVLLRLLRVTTQLPMIEFTHALDTLETLTDAFKLEQRVNLTISQDEEEEAQLNSIEQDYYEEYYNFETNLNSMNGEHRISIAQVDGSADEASRVTSNVSRSHPAQKRHTSLPDGLSELSAADLHQRNKIQRITL